MGRRASKIDFDRIILHGFGTKITFLMSIRTRNHTFDRFLKIFENFEKLTKNRFFEIVKFSCWTGQKFKIWTFGGGDGKDLFVR